jgi:hypothetical protein
VADADVQVKCAGGSGTTTTTASGGYTVSITGGKLPCMIRVSGNGGALVLHSSRTPRPTPQAPAPLPT